MRYDNQTIREIEHDSIRRWVSFSADAGFLRGRVLDYGAGQQPYRELVEAAGATYHPYDRSDYPGNVSVHDVGVDVWDSGEVYDSILCTQVLQYVEDPGDLLSAFRGLLVDDGMLTLTGPTNWPEVEPEDLHRHTRSGIRRLLELVGFEIVALETRDVIDLSGCRLPLGYGVVAQA